jgi:hypothetical protein
MQFTLLVLFAPLLAGPDQAMIYSNHTTPHLSYDACQQMAQQERTQASGDGFFVPYIRCVPDDQVQQAIAEANAKYRQVSGGADKPPLYTLRGRLTVDGKPVPEITSPHLTWDQCQDQIAKGQALVAAQHGRGVLTAVCERE